MRSSASSLSFVSMPAFAAAAPVAPPCVVPSISMPVMPAASWPGSSQKTVYMPVSNDERSSRAWPPGDRCSVRRSVFFTARLWSTVPSLVTVIDPSAATSMSAGVSANSVSDTGTPELERGRLFGVVRSGERLPGDDERHHRDDQSDQRERPGADTELQDRVFRASSCEPSCRHAVGREDRRIGTTGDCAWACHPGRDHRSERGVTTRPRRLAKVGTAHGP